MEGSAHAQDEEDRNPILSATEDESDADKNRPKCSSNRTPKKSKPFVPKIDQRNDVDSICKSNRAPKTVNKSVSNVQDDDIWERLSQQTGSNENLVNGFQDEIELKDLHRNYSDTNHVSDSDEKHESSSAAANENVWQVQQPNLPPNESSSARNALSVCEPSEPSSSASTMKSSNYSKAETVSLSELNIDKADPKKDSNSSRNAENASPPIRRSSLYDNVSNGAIPSPSSEHQNGHAVVCNESPTTVSPATPVPILNGEVGTSVFKCNHKKTPELPDQAAIDAKIRRRREREPMAFCKFVAKYPRTAFSLTLTCHLLFVFVTLVLHFVGYDIFPFEFQRFPMTLDDDEVRLREMAWTHRNNRTKDNSTERVVRFTTDMDLKVRNRSHSFDRLTLYYETSEHRNMFSKEILEQISILEDSIFYMPEYQKLFCQTNSTDGCIKPLSVLRYFDGTYKHIDPIFDDPKLENVSGVIYTAVTHEQTKVDFQYFMGANAMISKDKVVSSPVTRSYFPMGYPLPGFDDDGIMREAAENFLIEKVKPVIHATNDNKPHGLHVIYYSLFMFAHDVLKQVVYDLILAVGSFCFIFGFIWFQTRSLWVTGWAVFSIITGFCGANLIYRIVLDFRYFGFFHILAIFIILGIGADDIFVYYDNWRATKHGQYPSLAHRLSDCYRRAAGTMFVTSLTTMIAFLASAVSPILPVKTFGIFSGLLVMVNYLTVITFFPAVVIMYHVFFKGPCCSPCCTSDCENGHSNPDKKPAKNAIITFLSGKYFSFITHKVVRWMILLFFVVILAVFMYFACLLGPDEEELPIYKDSNNYGKAQNRRLHAFKPSEDDKYVTVYLVWGMKQRDRSMCHHSDFLCSGEQVWDTAFDMNTPPVQAAMQDMCNRLHNLTETEIDNLKVRRDPRTGKLQIACFMTDLENYLQTEQAKTVNGFHYYRTDLDLSFPITEGKAKAFMKANPQFYEIQSIPETFYRYFEIMISYWMSNGYTMTSTADFTRYNSLLGEWTDKEFTRNVKIVPGAKYGTKLRYIAIEVNTTMNAHALGYVTGLPVMNNWEEFMNNEVSQMPSPLQGGFQCTEHIWHWLKVQKNLADTAVTGIIIGICLAFPVLVLATQNFIVGLLATLSMCMITTCVVGVIPMAGWKLGVLTSLNLCLVVGLAVDYVVHLAEGYHLSPHKDRLGRVHDMLEHVGISVLSGAATTLGSSIFMMFAEIQFYVQFGIFIFSVIGFSILFSLGLFTTFLALLGPQGDTGSIRPLCKWIRDCAIGRDPKDEECERCRGRGFIRRCELNEESIKELEANSPPLPSSPENLRAHFSGGDSVSLPNPIVYDTVVQHVA